MQSGRLPFWAIPMRQESSGSGPSMVTARPGYAILLLIIGALALGFGLATAISLAEDKELVNWALTHWAFTYDQGFVKRALTGQVLSWFVEPSQLYPAALRAGTINSIAVAVALLTFFWRPFLRNREVGLLAFGVVASSHFATLQHFVYDVGRFDHIGLLITCLCVAAIDRMSAKVVAFLVGLLAALAVAIHEAFTIMFLPSIIAYWVWRHTPNMKPCRLHVTTTAVILGMTLVVGLTGPPGVAEQVYVTDLQAAHGPWISAKSVKVLYDGLGHETWRSVQNLLSFRRFVHHVVLALFLLPSFVLIVRVVLARRALGSVGQIACPPDYLLLIAAMSPLALYGAGIDFARWWAASTTNCFVILSLLIVHSQPWRLAVASEFERLKSVVVIAVLANLIAGPLGVAASPFPKIEPHISGFFVNLIGRLKNW